MDHTPSRLLSMSMCYGLVILPPEPAHTPTNNFSSLAWSGPNLVLAHVLNSSSCSTLESSPSSPTPLRPLQDPNLTYASSCLTSTWCTHPCLPNFSLCVCWWMWPGLPHIHSWLYLWVLKFVCSQPQFPCVGEFHGHA